MRHEIRVLMLAGAGLLLPGGMLSAQGGPGTTGAQVAEMVAGARAAGMAGAYTAIRDDADAFFYNPAGIAGLDRAASASYQRHVAEVSIGSAAGAYRFGNVTVGAGISFLDAGEIQVIEPDPDFGGERGRETGVTAASRESVLRLGAALPVWGERVRAGASVGFAASELAGVSRSAPLLDLGAQGEVMEGLVAALSLRNLGGSLQGAGAEDAPLPSQARAGLAYRWTEERGIGVVLSGDGFARLREETLGFAVGVEGGLYPQGEERFGGVVRLGYASDGGGEGLGPLHFGLGLAVGELALDYSYQSFEFFEAAHRIGVRWSRSRPLRNP